MIEQLQRTKIYKRLHELYNPEKYGHYYSIGKWQYLYVNGKHKISLIKIRMADKWLWEAYGFRMHYERRFKTRKQAEKYIMERLK